MLILDVCLNNISIKILKRVISTFTIIKKSK